jgi:hypothetical protein
MLQILSTEPNPLFSALDEAMPLIGPISGPGPRLKL